MKFNFWNFRQWLVFSVVFVVTATAVWFGYYEWYLQQYLNRPQSHQASGVFKSMKDNQLIIFASHTNDDNPDTQDFLNRQDLTVIISPDTKFVKTVWYFPESLESLTENRTKVDSATIQKEQQAGSVEDFKNAVGISVTVKTKNNSINQTTLKATEIDYIVYSYPE